MIFIILGALSNEEKMLVNDLFEDSNALLYNISMSLLHSHADAEDAVSASYIKIMNHIEKISKLPCPQRTPYCVMVVKNTSIDILRQRKHDVPYENMEAFEDAGITDEIWKVLDIREIKVAMSKLSQAERYILTLHYDSRLGYTEIAEMLEISEETAKKRGQRALIKLRELFEEGVCRVNGV